MTREKETLEESQKFSSKIVFVVAAVVFVERHEYINNV